MLARHYKNAATAARRTATSLRSMADHCPEAEAKGILLAAARVSEQIAKQNKAKADEQKRSEDAYAAAMKRLIPEAAAKIKAEWPITPTVKSVAIIALDRYKRNLASAFETLSTPSRYTTASQSFAEMVDDSIKNIAGSIAYEAHKNKTTVAVVICDYARKVQALYFDETVKRHAELIDTLLGDHSQVAA